MAWLELNKTTNLDKVPISTDILHGTLFTKEQNAHKFIITCVKDDEEVALSGTATGYVMLSNGDTLQLLSTSTPAYAGIENGKAWVVLPQACYVVPGRFQLSVMNTTTDGAVTCVYAAVGMIRCASNGTIYDPGEAIPSAEQLALWIEQCRTATADANEAATKSVRYDSAQSLTAAQKTQARGNIEAASADDVGELKSAVNSLDEFCRKTITHAKTQTTHVTAGTTIPSNMHIMDFTVPSGTTYTFRLDTSAFDAFVLYPNGNIASPINNVPSNTNNTYIASSEISYFTIYKTGAAVAETEDILCTVSFEVETTNSLEERIGNLEPEVEKTSDIVETTEHNPINWLNPENITSGYYWSSFNGADYTQGYSDASGYWNTGLIPVESGKTYAAQYGSELAASGSRLLCVPRWLMMYDENKKVVSSACVNGPSTAQFTVPSGIAYVILSISTLFGPNTEAYPFNSFNEGSTVIDFTEYFEPYTETTIKDSYIPDIPVNKIENILPVLSIVGDDCIVSKSASLSANASIELSNAPRYIKKNVGLSFWGNLTNFASLTIGKGFESYRGKWIVIDGTSVKLYAYENATTLVKTVSFDLSVSGYISVNMYMAASGIIKISINSVGGMFETEFDVSNEWNGIPFVKVGQAMTSVELSCAFADLRKPLWIFGDSYYGLQKNRVSGQLKQLGFFDGILVDSIAGQASFSGSDPAFAELERMLEFATPKYLIWDLGINGIEIESIAGLADLREVCNGKGITLILCLIPSVPNYNRDALNNAIRNSGERYADIEAAVGANNSGVWYSGFLSDDNVHPTENGAKAIAMKLLTDVPEIMMYGYSMGTAEGTSSGDASNLGN